MTPHQEPGVKLKTPPSEQHLIYNLQNKLLIISRLTHLRVSWIIKYYKRIQSRSAWQQCLGWIKCCKGSRTRSLGERHSGGRPDRQPCPACNNNHTTAYNNNNTTTLQPTMRHSVEPNLMDDVNRDWSLKITFASSPWGLRRPWI